MMYSSILIKRVLRSLVIALLAVTMISGCSTTRDPLRMAVAEPPPIQSFPAGFHRAMCVRTVLASDDAKTFTYRGVSADELRDALSTSLQRAGLLSAENACSYPTDANVLGMAAPGWGGDKTATLHANYKVYNATGEPILLETISSTHVTKWNEDLGGSKRARWAVEGAIRANILKFMEKLQQAVLPSGTDTGKK